jgi:hypothetical protein
MNTVQNTTDTAAALDAALDAFNAAYAWDLDADHAASAAAVKRTERALEEAEAAHAAAQQEQNTTDTAAALDAALDAFNAAYAWDLDADHAASAAAVKRTERVLEEAEAAHAAAQQEQTGAEWSEACTASVDAIIGEHMEDLNAILNADADEDIDDTWAGWLERVADSLYAQHGEEAPLVMGAVVASGGCWSLERWQTYDLLTQVAGADEEALAAETDAIARIKRMNTVAALVAGGLDREAAQVAAAIGMGA